MFKLDLKNLIIAITNRKYKLSQINQTAARNVRESLHGASTGEQAGIVELNNRSGKDTACVSELTAV